MSTLQESITIDIHSASKNLLEIENCIYNIKKGNFPDLQCEKIAKILSQEFKPVVVERVTVVHTTKKNTIFGSRVFPAKSHFDEIIEENRLEKRANIILQRCVIELDSKVLFEMDMNERQIVAILLHEMGHTLSDRKLIKPRSLLSSVCVIPLCLVSPGNHILFNLLLTGMASYYFYGVAKHIYLHKTEIEADSLAISCGYGEDLAQALDIISNYSFSSNVSFIESVKAEIRWGAGAIGNFEKRKNIIHRELLKKRKEEESPYMQELLDIQIASVEDRAKQDKRRQRAGMVNIKQDKLDEACNLYLESLIGIARKNYGLEADLISMEIGRIETTEDKLYLTNRIHKNITIARKSLEKISKNNPKDPRIPLLQDNIKKLEALVPQIRAVKTDINPFIIKVAYPKDDYEN